MMYPAPSPYYPFYGPLVYKSMYPGVGGKNQPRTMVAKQQSSGKTKVPAQPPLPVQRDDEDRSDSPGRVTPPPRTIPPRMQTGSPAASGATKKTPQKRVVAVNIPRMPVYPPYFAYPHYMMPPEDPRYMQMPVQAPYYYAYPNMPRQPYQYVMPQPMHVQVQPRPGSGSVSPANSSEGASRGTLPTSPTDSSSQSDGQSVSPGSGSGQTGQHYQLLPNVMHVPSHLLHNNPASGNNSRSSTPVLANSPTPQQQQAGMSRDSPRNSQGEIDYPSFRRRQHSGPRPVSQSPSYSSQGSHESSTSPVLNGDQVTSVYKSETQTVSKTHYSQTYSFVEKQSTIGGKAPRGLKLNTNTTGFSRQFSDELGTPTEITKIVKMIDENIDEVDEENETGSTNSNAMFSKDHHSKPSPPAGKLFLNLPMRASGSGDLPQSSSSSSQDDDQRPSYAGAVRQQLPSYRGDPELYDPALLEPQTPMTPAGFMTPGTDINTDPLEILRHLTINSDNLNRSAHGHF